MPRFVVVDRPGRRLYGDTGTLGDRGDVASAADAACLLDRIARRAPRGFGRVPVGSPGACLDVYRVDAAAPADAFAGEDLEAALRRWGAYETSLIGYTS